MTIKNILVTGIILCGVCLLFGQTMRVHTDNGVKTYELSEIDSITFDIDEQPIIDQEELEKLTVKFGELPEWTEINTTICTPDGCSKDINIKSVTARDYFNKGVSAILEEKMQIGENKMLTITIMDCGSFDNAETIFNEWYEGNENTLESVGSYPKTKAFIKEFGLLNGSRGHAFFNQYFILVHADGIGFVGEIEEANKNVVSGIELLNVKIDNL